MNQILGREALSLQLLKKQLKSISSGERFSPTFLSGKTKLFLSQVPAGLQDATSANYSHDMARGSAALFGQGMTYP
jgi:hypothetical protein